MGATFSWAGRAAGFDRGGGVLRTVDFEAVVTVHDVDAFVVEGLGDDLGTHLQAAERR